MLSNAVPDVHPPMLGSIHRPLEAHASPQDSPDREERSPIAVPLMDHGSDLDDMYIYGTPLRRDNLDVLDRSTSEKSASSTSARSRSRATLSPEVIMQMVHRSSFMPSSPRLTVVLVIILALIASIMRQQSGPSSVMNFSEGAQQQIREVWSRMSWMHESSSMSPEELIPLSPMDAPDVIVPAGFDMDQFIDELLEQDVVEGIQSSPEPRVLDEENLNEIFTEEDLAEIAVLMSSTSLEESSAAATSANASFQDGSLEAGVATRVLRKLLKGLIIAMTLMPEDHQEELNIKHW